MSEDLGRLVALYGHCICDGEFCSGEDPHPWECQLCGALDPEADCPKRKDDE